MYKTLFGPVPSRRLGLSLGIDLTPHKTCSFNCIYCECKATTNLTVERKIMVDTELVKNELELFMLNNRANLPEIFTFSGSGEPTLALNLGEITSFIKSKFKLPVCTLTNSSLIDRPDVQEDLMKSDIVIPSLDAVSPEIFKQIDRPHPSVKIENIISGLIKFSKKFKGKIYIEALLIKGINDSSEELKKISDTVNSINPTAIQLNTVVRPGTISDLKALNYEELKNAAALFKTQVHIALSVNTSATGQHNNSALVEMLKRRACSAADLIKIYGLKNEDELEKILNGTSQKIITAYQNNEKFYSLEI